jgi:thiol peroxidase
MVQITLKGNPINTHGAMAPKGSKAPNFTLTDKDLNDVSLNKFSGKMKVIATVPSLDTGVCSLMTKHLSHLAKKHPDVAFITISCDLPFAQARFCSTEGVDNVLTLSMMRNKDFGKDSGLLIVDGPLAGILARSLTVLDENDLVIHSELVSEIAKEPNYKVIDDLLTK